MSENVVFPNSAPPFNPQDAGTRKRKRWRRPLIYALLAYAAWCATLFFYQDRLVFPADMAPPAPRRPPPGADVLSVPVEGGGQVEALFWPANGARAGKTVPVVVFCHGNAELADFQDDIARPYLALGCSVFVPEYRGYGRSGGRPAETVIVADTVQLYDLMLQRPDVARARIAIHGRSLGGGIAAQLAARRAPAALILESTFTSIATFAWGYGAPSLLSTSPFHTDRVIGDFKFPLLIFHGSQDPIVPVAHGRKLHELAPTSKYVEYAADHNGFPGRQNEAQYWSEIEIFLRLSGVLR